MTTFIFVRHSEIGGRVFTHGSELPPGTLTKEVVNQLIDAGHLKEYQDRRSLFRIFHRFAGCSERERLSQDELAAYTLPP
jgi:hypothetical protein